MYSERVLDKYIIFSPLKIMFMTNRKRSGRGFASMDPDERREIASRGGRASQGRQNDDRYDENNDRRVNSRYDDDDRYEDEDYNEDDRRGSQGRERYEDDDDDDRRRVSSRRGYDEDD